MDSLTEYDIAQNNTAYFEKLFREMNPSGAPEVGAGHAAEFLKGSGLPIPSLSVIWEIADYRKIGSLNKKGVFIALKLVAAVQQGRPTSIDLKSPLDPPRFPSIPPSARASPALSNVSTNMEWEITPTEFTKYEAIFNNLNPVNGKVTGEIVRPVLLNSNLPQHQLVRIWEMADLDKDGMLDIHEMCIAMHLVYKCIETKVLPNQLPAALYHSSRKGSVIGSRTTSAVTSPTSSRIIPPPMLPSSRTSSVASLNRADTRSIGSDSYPQRPGMKSIFDPTITQYPIDVQLWEDDFTKLDLDRDGYVTGMDTKITLMGSGLNQQVLAHIWSLVDIVKTGRLNAEQFALVMELVKEARLGIKLPEILPAHLIPPSLRASIPNMPLSPSEKANPKLKELGEEIEQIIQDRRKADIGLAQLEADITIKTSAVKNLEIELNTLVATVKQLQNQKGEAQKRLAEMDDRIDAYRSTLEEGKKRLAYEEDRLNSTRVDLTQAKQSADTEEQALFGLREELRNLDNSVYQQKIEINKANQEVTKFASESTEMDQKKAKHDAELIKINDKKAQLEKDVQELEKVDEPSKDNILLNKRFEQLNASGIVQSTSNNTFSANFDNAFGSPRAPPPDPFKNNADPFGEDANFDPFSNAKTNGTSSFGSFDKDPFGQADPFSSSTTTTSQTNNFADFARFSSFGN